MRRPILLLALVAAAASALAFRLFPRAFPILAVEGRLPRADIRVRADSILRTHDLAPVEARRAIRFSVDDSLRTFVELGGGGKDSLDALLRAGTVALFHWDVRVFQPGEVREARLQMAPDGRLIGFRRVLPDSLARPALDSTEANALAERIIGDWLHESRSRWTLRSSSLVTQPGSGRLDRTFTFERPDRTVAGAAIRLDVVIAGDLAAEARPYVEIPESFSRRYDEMRSANDLLALLATIGILALAVAAVFALRHHARTRSLRWRWPATVGSIIGALMSAAVLNDASSSWYVYNTADSPAVHQFVFFFGAIAAGAGTALMVTLTLAAAEVLTRHAFPWHADWWQLWRYRGSREVAGAVFGGYAMAAIGFAYIATFYLVTRNFLGWWVPSEILDDPNQIATPFPWLAGIALSLQAAVWEESLFRAIPLSLIAIWTRDRQDRERWLALGVVGTALVFGFAHSNYASWPPYSRGVEIFLEACVWAVLFLRFGLLVPVLAHFVFDLVLFGLFATGGSAPQYRVTAVIMLVVLLAPALAVAWARLRQGAWVLVPDEGRFRAWSAPPVGERTPVTMAPAAATIEPRSRQLALLLAVVAIAGTVMRPAPRTAGPAFSATRDEVLAVADSVVRSRGVDPGRWKRLVSVPVDTGLVNRALFLERHHAESLAVSLSADYAIPRWWLVRYVRTEATVAERAEEWRVRVLPDGSPLGVRHLVPREAPGASLVADSARILAQSALVQEGLDTARFVEADVREDPRENRTDFTFTYTDTTVALPADATARVRVAIAGGEVLSVLRSIELPEAFEREVRGETMRNLAFAGTLGMVALALCIWGVVRLSRRPPLRHDGISKRLRLGLLGTLLLVTLVESLLGLNGSLAAWDTSTPWDQFIGTVVTSQFMMVVFVLLLAALWMLTNGMRRRAGIPLLAKTRTEAGLPDEIVAGAGLGALLPLISLGWALVRPDAVPGPPSTALDRLVPLLNGVPGVISNIASTVPVAAILGLATLGMASGSRGRLGGATVLLALFGMAMLAVDPRPGLADPRALTFGVVAITAIIAGVRAWGGLSVVAWINAALFSGLLGDLGTAFRATTMVERGSGLISAVLALVLAWFLYRWVNRHGQPGPGDTVDRRLVAPDG